MDFMRPLPVAPKQKPLKLSLAGFFRQKKAARRRLKKPGAAHDYSGYYFQTGRTHLGGTFVVRVITIRRGDAAVWSVQVDLWSRHGNPWWKTPDLQPGEFSRR